MIIDWGKGESNMLTERTSRSAVADKLHCRVGKFWQKYKWKANYANYGKLRLS